jgi:hypothetical protein
MWSVAMLLRAPSGPKGTEWDPAFLRDLGNSMLDWRDRTPQRPEPVSRPGYQVPQFGYRDLPGNWYNALGVSGEASNVRSGSDNPTLAELNKYDPCYAILDRLGENPSASADLLSGSSGAEDARRLMSPYWGSPVPGGFGDESAHAAAALEAGAGATTDPVSKDHPPHSVRQDYPGDPRYAQAAANVFEAASAYAQGGEKYTPQWGHGDTAGFPHDISDAQRRKPTSVGTCY